MDRVPNHRFAPAIDRALQITRSFHRYIGTPHFLCGVDPSFAGLHRFGDTTDGRAYRDTAHVAYPNHQAHLPAMSRRTTVVLPTPREPWTIVHELGHVLHEAIDFDIDLEPVTAYATTNRWEAFAEAFAAYHFLYGDFSRDNKAFFDSLI